MSGVNVARLCYLYLTSDVAALLEQAVLNSGEKKEVCGLLGGIIKDAETAIATVVCPLSNISLRDNSFAVNPDEFRQQQTAVEVIGLSTLATYHSHPGASTKPSFRDMELPRITNLPALILARSEGETRAACYGHDDGGIIPITVVAHHDISN